MRVRLAVVVACLFGICAPALFGALTVTPAYAAGGSSSDTLPFTIGTPELAQISSTASAQAPWNEFQGDPEGDTGANTATGEYTSNGVGTLYPTYTPGGVTTDIGGVTEPNLAVVSGATSPPYPAGVVGTPGTLEDYCGSGSNATEGSEPVSTTSISRQPIGTTLPLAPAYFPHITRNSDGSLTGYFDYRPKDADEAIVAATSTDNGGTWSYDGEALEENPGYCPTADLNDDGEGHPNVITINGQSFMYTLPRAAGDMAGVGMVVHQFDPTEQNPLPTGSAPGDLPASEQVGVDPDAFVTAPTNISLTTSSSATIPLTTLGQANSPEDLVTGSFIDLTVDPDGTAPTVINCTASTTAIQLTNCDTSAGTLTVRPGDLIEQVLGFTTTTSGSRADEGSVIPPGPNNTGGTAGLADLYVDTTGNSSQASGFTNPLSGATINTNAPDRLYVNGTAIYCTQANANPTNKVEDCTTGPAGPNYTISAKYEPITTDPIIPASSYDPAAGDGMTTGLVAPDGIVGTIPSYPNNGSVPAGATYVMYTEKELNYYLAGDTSAGGTIAYSGDSPSSFSITFNPGPYVSQDLTTDQNGDYDVYVGATSNTSSATAIVPVSCTTLSTGATYTLSGCSSDSPSYNGWTFASSSYVGAPGAAVVSAGTLGEIGEGSSTNVAKLYKNNEDLTLLRVAYTTNGVTFSTSGLANGGVISGNNNCQSANADPVCSSPANADSSDSYSPYDDISNPTESTSPSNLNAYADNDAANGTGPSTGGTDAGGGPDQDEMRFVGSAGSVIDNDGTLELFLSGAWAADGDSDSFNQIFYSTSTNGEYWTVPTPVISTDYTFAASLTQENQLAQGQDDPLGISAYYSGRAYAPSVVQNPDGTLTMVFAGDRIPKSVPTAGEVLGTNPNAQYTVGASDPALYRNILTVTLQPSSDSAQPTTTTLTSTATATTTTGDQVTYTATVTPSSAYAGPPTGTVSFLTALGTPIAGCGAVPLSELTPDTATCTTTYDESVGDNVQVLYGGDSLFAPSENEAWTTTTLTSSDGGSAVTGETVTYTASVTVTPSAGTAPFPSGTVSFADSAGDLDCATQSLTATPSAGGTDYTAECSVYYPGALADPDTVTASYTGDPDTLPSSGQLSETVDTANTTTSVTSSDNGSATAGDTVTFTASVGVESPGTGAPQGTVDFSDLDGYISDCSLSLVGGTAECSATFPAALATADTITASYEGETGYYNASSGNTPEAVSQVATAVGLSSTASSIVVGQPVTVTAALSGVPGNADAPTGTVSFSDSAGVIGAACPSQAITDVDGTYEASCTTTFSSAVDGGDSITATYNGDSNYLSESSPTTPPTVLDVGPAATTTVLAALSPIVVTQSVTYSATVGVSSPGEGIPTGTVTFFGAGGTEICPPVTVSDGEASCTTSYDSPGSEPVTADYTNTDGNFVSSNSSTATEVVSQDSTAVVLSASPDPALAGQPTSLTALVLVSSGSSTPTGTVTFTSGSTTLCSGVALVAGSSGETATCDATFANVSADLSVTATYSGDTNELGSAQSLSLAVAHATHLNLSATPSSAAYGHQITLRAGGLPAAAGGTVVFSVLARGESSATTPCSVTLTSGAAKCVLSSPLLVGSYTATASYQPSGTTYGASSATAGFTVLTAPAPVMLRATPRSSSYGTTVELVASNLPTLATGTLTFSIGSTTVCTVAAAASATCVVPGPLTPRNYGATVEYSGDSNYEASSAATTFTVTKALPSFGVTVSATANSVTLSASLPASATGTVSFVSGQSLQCTNEPVSDGSATCTVGSLSARTYRVTALYSGDANYRATSASVSFTISDPTAGH